MSFTNQEPVDCPICFDAIGEKNSIVTECGHKFHASCLMTNVSRNGFGCPCCRSAMVENVREEEVWTDDGSEYDGHDDDSDDESSIRYREFARIHENDDDDDDDDDDDNDDDEDDNEDDNEDDDDTHNSEPHDHPSNAITEYILTRESHSDEVVNVPSHDFVTNKLREKGVTYEQLVAWILIDHDEYSLEEDELERFAGDIWGKIKMIVSNYNATTRSEVVPIVETEVRPVVETEVVPIVEPEVVPIVEPPVEQVEEHILREWEPNESPIPNFEWYDMLLADDDEDIYNFDNKISFDDLEDLRVVLSDLWDPDFRIINTAPMCV